MQRAFSFTPIKAVAWIAGPMIAVVLFHVGGTFALRVGQFGPLCGALIGSCLTLVSACFPRRRGEQTEPWIGFEQLSWILLGMGMLLWSVGEGFWRYFVALGMTPFPSVADIGYSLFPPLAFAGLLLQPRPDAKSLRIVLIMDSLISMGALFALAWYLLLGSLAQAPGEVTLAKFLGLYYPVSDTALFSCIVVLLLRGQQGHVYQAAARRVSLLLVGLGVCFFVASDFAFNVQQNAGTYVEATWLDLGWPLGMMTMGIAAYVRRFLPATSAEVIAQRMEQQFEQTASNPFQFLPYGLLGLLLLALTLDVLASDSRQQAIRPVLLFTTLSVVALVVVRQILMLRDNIRLTERQAEALERLEDANRRVEEQARQIAEHNAELERGIEHLRTVHAHLANGHLNARATLRSGALMPLAGSLNLLAERLMRLGQAHLQIQHLLTALGDLSVALEHFMAGEPFVMPPSCEAHMEIRRLLVVLRMKGVTLVPPPTKRPSTSSPVMPTFPRQAATPAPTPLPHAPFSVTEPLYPSKTASSAPSQTSELPQRVLGVRRPPNSGPFGRSAAQERK
jgi:hypothetical protein